MPSSLYSPSLVDPYLRTRAALELTSPWMIRHTTLNAHPTSTSSGPASSPAPSLGKAKLVACSMAPLRKRQRCLLDPARRVSHLRWRSRLAQSPGTSAARRLRRRRSTTARSPPSETARSNSLADPQLAPGESRSSPSNLFFFDRGRRLTERRARHSFLSVVARRLPHDFILIFPFASLPHSLSPS